MNKRLRELINFYISSGKVKSDADFARYISKSPTVLCGMLSGKRVITDKALRLIASVFPEVNYDWLATGEGEMLRPAEQQTHLGATRLLQEAHASGFDPKKNPNLRNPEPHVKYQGELSGTTKGLVYEEDFKAVCDENTQLKITNSKMRRRMFELMEKLAQLGYPCSDDTI